MTGRIVPPRLRFFVFLLPRIAIGRCGVMRLIRYSDLLAGSGNRVLAKWCLDRAVREIVNDRQQCEQLIDACLDARFFNAAEALANGFFDANGMNPAVAARFLGKLALSGGWESLSRLFERFVQARGEDVGAVSPSPMRAVLLHADELRPLCVACESDDAESHAARARLYRGLSQLCFSFSAFETSVRLMELAAKYVPLKSEERIGAAYARLRSDKANQACREVEVGDLDEMPATRFDLQIMLATVRFASGAWDDAVSLVEKGLRSQAAEHPDVEGIIEDCVAIAYGLRSMEETLKFHSVEDQPGTVNDDGAIPKIFVCGNGWSGSGALYDALTDYDGLAVAPNTPVDRYMNACTDNEMTFVQSPAGLGRLWRLARDQGQLLKLDLWDTVRLHVLGGGAVGYSEYKASLVARNLRLLYGRRYTAVFRRLFERIEHSEQPLSLQRLREIFMDATEALSTLFAGREEASGRQAGGYAVLYNNAIFGPAIDMLEIFRNAKAAFVVRDPLDQFADRRAQDFKQWMSPSRYVTHYQESRASFGSGLRRLRPDLSEQVREVAFERFVLDEEYRKSVIAWLLEASQASRVRQRYEPERSARNIGIHAGMLDAHESTVLDAGLYAWRPRSGVAEVRPGVCEHQL